MKLHKDQLATYLQLNGSDCFDVINPVKDIVQTFILDDLDWEDTATVLGNWNRLSDRRSCPMIGEIYLGSHGVLCGDMRATIHPLPGKTPTINPRVTRHVTDAHIRALVPSGAFTIGSFVIVTKNYPDVFCDSGKWYTLTFDSGTGILEIVAR